MLRGLPMLRGLQLPPKPTDPPPFRYQEPPQKFWGTPSSLQDPPSKFLGRPFSPCYSFSPGTTTPHPRPSPARPRDFGDRPRFWGSPLTPNFEPTLGQGLAELVHGPAAVGATIEGSRLADEQGQDPLAVPGQEFGVLPDGHLVLQPHHLGLRGGHAWWSGECRNAPQKPARGTPKTPRAGAESIPCSRGEGS